MPEEEIEVVVQIGGEDVFAGRAWRHGGRRGESATFTYDAAYLARPDAYELDPALPLEAGQRQTAVGRHIFGAFSDCAPDRWGRRLIKRYEKQRAKPEGLSERSFGEFDYLLGVRDDMRQGALRFRRRGETLYLAPEDEGVPPLVALPTLLNAAEEMERDEADVEQLRLLLRGGSSLGGARPKAHVLDPQGRAAIAKFPSPKDEWEVIRWESVALSLAADAGIEVPAFQLHSVDGKPVLVVDRFDRRGGKRIGYVSAMTMLEADDGEEGATYLDIVEVIEQRSPAVERDLEQLWRRVAFNVLISNTDDHLRNHGFLRTSTAGWALAPAFDLNPDPEPGPKQLSTAIDDGAPTASIEKLLGVAEYFGLGDEATERALTEVLSATGDWRTAAAAAGLDRAAIATMSSAFEHEEREKASELTGTAGHGRS
jgi:serine/threonine-protein kinase HipA